MKTTEQVVKNYLRKIYDKLNVADRLELALYSMHHRLLDGYVFPSSDKTAETVDHAPAVQPAVAEAGSGSGRREHCVCSGRWRSAHEAEARLSASAELFPLLGLRYCSWFSSSLRGHPCLLLSARFARRSSSAQFSY